jgi:hypothetical protein
MHFDAHISCCLSCSLSNCCGKLEGNNAGFLGPLIGLFLSFIPFLSSGIEACHRYYLPKFLEKNFGPVIAQLKKPRNTEKREEKFLKNNSFFMDLNLSGL